MNNENKIIDLSRAYEGQYITLANGKKYRIGNISFFAYSYDIISYCDELNESYLNDGRNYNGDNALDIIAIEDPIQVQAARLEGEIKGLEYYYEYAMVNDMQMRSLLLKKLNSLKEQLKALTENN